MMLLGELPVEGLIPWIKLNMQVRWLKDDVEILAEFIPYCLGKLNLRLFVPYRSRSEVKSEAFEVKAALFVFSIHPRRNCGLTFEPHFRPCRGHGLDDSHGFLCDDSSGNSLLDVGDDV